VIEHGPFSLIGAEAQVPDPLHVLALHSSSTPGLTHVVPTGWNESAGQAPAPLQLSATSQSPAAARHTSVVGSLLDRQVPDPLQVSGLSQTVSLELPQAVAAGLNPSAGQDPAPSQLSATSQSPAAARHTSVVGSLFDRQVPEPLQVSGLSQTVSLELPQAVAAGLNPSAGQEPAPSQLSATSQSPAAARHTVVVGALFAKQVPVASQVSGALQVVEVGSPQPVPLGSNTSAGQEPAPSQYSATSQSPASARHSVVVAALFAWHVPVALHVSGALHVVEVGSPQAVPLGSKPSAGQAPAPSQYSATSQSPASARHRVVVAALFARQVPVASQVSGLLQVVAVGLPQAVPLGSNTSAGQEPAPSQYSATSQSPASARHRVVVAALFAWQVPVALQVSGALQVVEV